MKERISALIETIGRLPIESPPYLGESLVKSTRDYLTREVEAISEYIDNIQLELAHEKRLRVRYEEDCSIYQNAARDFKHKLNVSEIQLQEAKRQLWNSLLTLVLSDDLEDAKEGVLGDIENPSLYHLRSFIPEAELALFSQNWDEFVKYLKPGYEDEN